MPEFASKSCGSLRG